MHEFGAWDCAKEKGTSRIVGIKDAVANKAYHCLDCNANIHAVLGDVRAHHFRHAKDTDCAGYGGSAESATHRQAKKKLVQRILLGDFQVLFK